MTTPNNDQKNGPSQSPAASSVSFKYVVDADVYNPQPESGKAKSAEKKEYSKKPFDWDKFEAITQSGLAIITLLVLAVEVVFLAWTISKQNEAIHQTAIVIGQNKALIEASQVSARAASDQTQAVKDSAQAAKDSASGTNTAIEQNKELIKSARIQADTSQISARAAESAANATIRSVEVAERTLILAESPYVVITKAFLDKPLVDKENSEGARAVIEIKNTGRTPAIGEFYIYALVRPLYDLGTGNEQEILKKIDSFSGAYLRQYTLAENTPVTVSTIVAPLTANNRANPQFIERGPPFSVYVLGKVVYRDIFSKEITVPFCFEAETWDKLEMSPCGRERE